MHVLMSCVKDEGPFVLEFVAHHLAAGFDRILMASNDCSDGTDDLLEALHQAGFVQHLNHAVAAGEIPQHVGYAKLRARFGLDGAEWLMVLDVDEFLNVALPFGTVQALTKSAPKDIDIIALNAATFGTDLGAQWQAGLVCAQFTHRFGLGQSRNSAIKSLTRAPQRFGAIHNHSMVRYRGDTPLQVMRGNGDIFTAALDIPLWKQLRNIKPNSDKSRPDFARYHHYAVKTYDSFALRRARGRGAKPAQTSYELRHSDDYFAAHIGASVLDTSISAYAPAVQSILAQMLAHPAVAAAQTATEQRYGAMLAKYQMV